METMTKELLEESLYFYKVKKVVKVVDGDTVDAIVDLGFKVFVDQRFRLLQVNTPEIYHPTIEGEKEAGYKMKEFVEDLFLNKLKDKELFVKTKKVGKYGRYLATFYYFEDRKLVNINNYIAEKNKIIVEEYRLNPDKYYSIVE